MANRWTCMFTALAIFAISSYSVRADDLFSELVKQGISVGLAALQKIDLNHIVDVFAAGMTDVVQKPDFQNLITAAKNIFLDIEMMAAKESPNMLRKLLRD